MRAAFSSPRAPLQPPCARGSPVRAERHARPAPAAAVVARASARVEAAEPGWLRQAAAAFAAGVLLLSPQAAGAAADAGDVLVGPPRVVDGDTLVVAGERIRLFGLDAPESKQSCSNARGQPYACGQAAAEALRQKIGSASVQCKVRQKDLYGRSVSSCQLPGTGDLGDWLVSNGHAVAYRQYSKEYVGDEEAAKAARRGVWQGSFENPADWRKDNRGGGRGGGSSGSGGSTQVAEAAGPLAGPLANLGGLGGRVGAVSTAAAPQHPPGCDVKGNVSSRGDRIYHVPSGRYYAGVKIEPEKGERFFCSEAEAEGAGFRKSRE